MRNLNCVCLCEISSVYMCVNLLHTQVSTKPVLSMSGICSGLCSLLKHFWVSLNPDGIVHSIPDDTFFSHS